MDHRVIEVLIAKRRQEALANGVGAEEPLRGRRDQETVTLLVLYTKRYLPPYLPYPRDCLSIHS